MGELSFDKTIDRFDLIISDMNDADKKNNLMFRRVCKEVFQKSYSKLEIKNNLNIGKKMAAVGVSSAIKIVQRRYKKGSFTKLSKKLNHQTNVFTYSDLKKINRFLEISEFALVVKLLKTQYNYGLDEAVSSIHFTLNLSTITCVNLDDSFQISD